jgi:DNA helicase-2/ATP-dependent DNA helicase PcrA
MQDDVSEILEGLNEAQREAVAAPAGGALILAGAGSGKTRVLVHHIAWLIAVEGASPWNILAVTFTNKAAREMRQRIEHLLDAPVGGMWVGTFHGLAHRFLRAHWEDAKLPQNFQVMDSDDQFRLVKRITKGLELDEARWPSRQAQWFINARKDEGLRAAHIDPGGDFHKETLLRVYAEYEKACQRGGLVDFAELLLRTHETLRERADILEHYRHRFPHILVDEFQDTNDIQYAWLRLLAGADSRIFAVGDDDQSIYGWRGAKVENIRDFQKHYPAAPLIRLEQNYRSTGNILEAANSLIAHNPSRLGKNLWTDYGQGELIGLYAAFDEMDEARFVIERIKAHVEEGGRRSEAAILYRSNAQSRQFEERLIQAGIPYRVYGGLRFFERAEVKDALAYLRLLANRDDDGAFERAVNQPPRGIGPKTLDLVRARARAEELPLWRAATLLLGNGELPKRAATALQAFLDLIDEQREVVGQMELYEAADHLIGLVGLPEHFEKSKDGKGQDRIENLAELVNAIRQFEYEDLSEEMDQLSAFLAHAALEAGETQAGPDEDCVQLMTLHSAKGLEFPLVFIGGVEEGLFPRSMSIEDPERLEEERRLCYVGMTRAMRKLYLCHAEIRRLRGQEEYTTPSRFLREIPAQLIDEVRGGSPRISQPVYGARTDLPDQAGGGYSLGQRVSHPKFGEGVVINAEGKGAGARVQVNFEAVGAKWLVLSFANLQVL